MDESNAAVIEQMKVGPATLEDVAKDLKVTQATARKMLFLQMQKLHTALRDPTVPIPQRLSIAEFFAKVGDVYPKAATAAQQAPLGSGFGVNIILNQTTPQSPSSLPNLTIIENSPGSADPQSGSDLVDHAP